MLVSWLIMNFLSFQRWGEFCRATLNFGNQTIINDNYTQAVLSYVEGKSE